MSFLSTAIQLGKLICVATLMSFSGLLTAQVALPGEDHEAILRALRSQQTHWNEGNIEAFMEGYWRSDSLVFVGKQGPKYGWETTLNRYKQAYPDQAAMGQLAFDVISTEVLSPTHVIMLGKWQLTRANDTPGGFFTLIWRKVHDKWVIVYDHTS